MSSNAPRSLSGLKILVIDDSKTIRRTAETLLTKEGCQVFTAIDGFDALSKIADHRPDLIFVDIMMPRLDGYETCSLIKHNKTFRDTPVIMLSSKDGLFDRARGRIVWSVRCTRCHLGTRRRKRPRSRGIRVVSSGGSVCVVCLRIPGSARYKITATLPYKITATLPYKSVPPSHTKK